MTTPAVRLTQLEAAVDRLAASRGPRVSDLMRQARARAIAGEAPAPVLSTVEELEAAARGRGLAADMARSALRLLRDPGRSAIASARVRVVSA